MSEHPATKSRFANARRVSDVTDSGQLWPDLPKVETESLIGPAFLILEYRSIKSQAWQGPYYIIKCCDANGVEFTTATSGAVVGRKLDEMGEKGAFPVVATFWQSVPAQRGQSGYFDLRDPADGAAEFELVNA